MRVVWLFQFPSLFAERRRAEVSVVFLRSHPDLLQAIEDAGQQYVFDYEKVNGLCRSKRQYPELCVVRPLTGERVA